jgi:hypothetical protein
MTNKEKILEILSTINREGVNKLISHLNDSTFFNDPASSNGYNNYEGGLAEHSLNVYDIIKKYAEINPELKEIEDSLKIVGLLHSIAYVGCYQKTSKNIPLRGSDGKNKKNENGKLIFIEKESYDFFPENQLPYSEGHLATILLKQFIKLTKLEDLAIVWQNGYSQNESQNYLIDRALKKHKLIMLTYFAKKEAILFHNKSKN